MPVTITLSDDDEAVFIDGNNRTQAVLPDGRKAMTERHAALLGAAYQVANDPAYRAAALAAFRLFHTPATGEA